MMDEKTLLKYIRNNVMFVHYNNKSLRIRSLHEGRLSAFITVWGNKALDKDASDFFGNPNKKNMEKLLHNLDKYESSL